MTKLIFSTLIVLILFLISVQSINLRHELPKGWENWTKADWDKFLHKHAPKSWGEELNEYSNTEEAAKK